MELKKYLSAENSVLPNYEKLYAASELFKVFGDTTRLKILYTLFDAEKCVGDIASDVEMSSSAVSHQLKVLRQARLVGFRREGKAMLYSLADSHIRTLLDCAIEHISE